MTEAAWIQALSPKERAEYARALAKREKAMDQYRAVYIKLKRRADSRIHLKKQRANK